MYIQQERKRSDVVLKAAVTVSQATRNNVSDAQHSTGI